RRTANGWDNRRILSAREQDRPASRERTLRFSLHHRLGSVRGPVLLFRNVASSRTLFAFLNCLEEQVFQVVGRMVDLPETRIVPGENRLDFRQRLVPQPAGKQLSFPL